MIKCKHVCRHFVQIYLKSAEQKTSVEWPGGRKEAELETSGGRPGGRKPAGSGKVRAALEAEQDADSKGKIPPEAEQEANNKGGSPLEKLQGIGVQGRWPVTGDCTGQQAKL